MQWDCNSDIIIVYKNREFDFMKATKRLFALLLAGIMLFTMLVPSFAVSGASWEQIWSSTDAAAGIIMFPGSNESERNFSWYSETESEPVVTISQNPDLSSAQIFKGTCIKAVDGDFANKVTITGLSEGTTYYYKCTSDGFESQIYSFTTSVGTEFSAMYVTDIHITENDEGNENSLSDSSYRFHQVYEAALTQNRDISLILSAGDQATEGLESEYKALTASPLLKSVSIATTIGNHDRKGVAYSQFKNLPNEDEKALIHSHNGTDYWFVKGNVLFLVMDSNSGNGSAHADFVKRAVKANPDVKWKVMMCHHDLYSGRIPHRESENALLRMIWGPIADQFGIDLVLLGHSHYYTVTDVLYKNKTVSELQPEMVDPKGTVYMVSCSLDRPRNDEDMGLNEWVGFDYLTENATYNILDFTEDSITVNSYELGEDTPFNTFTIKKTTHDGGHEKPGAITTIKNIFVRSLSAVYTIFNNLGTYSDLKEKDYDVSLSDFFGKID